MQEVTIITYVLDDDRDDLLLIQEKLKEIPECVYSLHDNVEEFLSAVDRVGAHIAIIDYRLNGKVNGIEVGRKVLEKNRLSYLIMLSGGDDKKAIAAAMNVGFRWYIDKGELDYLDELKAVVTRQLKPVSLLLQIQEKLKNEVPA